LSNLTLGGEFLQTYSDVDQVEVWNGGQISHKFTTLLTTAVLVGSLLAERYFFLVTVVKTENFTFAAVFCVILLNWLVSLILKLMQPKRVPNRLHELFRIEQEKEVSNWIIGLVG
jgi:hypothetical protein